MSSPNPITDPVALFAQAFWTFITGKFIESASGQTAQLARAQQLLAAATGFEEVINGNTSGLAALQTALLNLVKTISDPAVQLAFNGLIAAGLSEIAAFTQSGSLLAKLGGVPAEQVLGFIAATAQTYVTSLTSPAAAK